MKLYLDNCCYNRPFDDQVNDRVYLESEAILAIMKRSQLGLFEIIGSEVLDLEVQQMKHESKRQKVKELHQMVHINVAYTEEMKKRSQEIRALAKIRMLDSLHIAAAESANADILLTTDSKMIKRASIVRLKIRVENPLQFVWEVF